MQIDSAKEQLLNLDVTSPSFSLESYGLHSMALRYKIEGMAEFADIDSLKDWLVEEVNDGV